MKALKKLSCLLLAVLLLMSVSVTAFAADDYAKTNITIKDEEGHTYRVYQIVKGNYAEVTEEGGVEKEVLSDVAWGKDVNEKTKAQDVEKVLKTWEGMTAEAISAQYKDLVAEGSGTVMSYNEDLGQYELNGVETGYYLIVEEGAVAGETVSKYMVQVAGETGITPKRSGIPEFQKKVKDVNDSTGVGTDWQDSADYDIGDAVPFQLQAKLPTGLANYDTYTLTFRDTLSDGLTLVPKSIKVYVDSNQITTGFGIVNPASDGHSFDVVFEDVKTVDGVKDESVITVEYDAILNDGAVIGGGGNPNTAQLQYSNNPNNEETGTSTPDKVVVFTYQFEADKVEPAGSPDPDTGKVPTKSLEGAAFTLYKEVSAKIEGKTTELDGEEYTGKYYVVVGEYTVKAGQTEFGFTGLDDGNYVLIETATPPGYNSVDNIEFTISAEHDSPSEAPTLKKLEATGDEIEEALDGTATGKITMEVVNQKGLELPETGGIGTTIFYAVGGVLVVAALVLLVTKKRMSKEG